MARAGKAVRLDLQGWHVVRVAHRCPETETRTSARFCLAKARSQELLIRSVSTAGDAGMRNYERKNGVALFASFRSESPNVGLQTRRVMVLAWEVARAVHCGLFEGKGVSKKWCWERR